jgi:hypothetical protein
MVKFKIDDVRYEIPDYISIDKYVKIFKVKNLFSDDYFQAKIVSIVSDAPIEVLLDSDYSEIQKLATYVMSLIPMDKPEFINRFEMDGVNYGFIPDWKDLSFAEFADLDTLSTKKQDEILDVLHIIASIMYRPIIEEKKNGDFRIEKYNVDSMKERAELFKRKLNVKYLLGAQFFFYQLRKQIFKLFPVVFDAELIDLAEDKIDMDYEEMVSDDNFLQKTYGWFAIVNRVTENDITKHQAIYEKKLIEVLNQLSFLVSFEKEQIKLQKKLTKTI